MNYRQIATISFIIHLEKKYSLDMDKEVEEYYKDNDISESVLSKLSIDNILYIIETREKLPLGCLKGKSRKREYVVLRHCFSDILYGIDKNSFKLKFIGKCLDRDHSSILYGIQKVKDMFDIKDHVYMSAHSLVMDIVESEIDSLTKPLQNCGVKYYTSFYAKSSANV